MLTSMRLLALSRICCDISSLLVALLMPLAMSKLPLMMLTTEPTAARPLAALLPAWKIELAPLPPRAIIAGSFTPPAAADSAKETPLRVSARSSQITPQAPSFLVSADRATCVMVAAAAAGAPSAREAETFLGLSNDLRDDSTDVSFSDAFSSPPLRFSDGAESSLASLVAALAPAAHPASARAFKLAVCVSLNGPKGVGKRSVARAAADALRLARVEVNCHEMLADAGGGGSGDRVIVALEAAFDAAAAVGPALLYLRRFDALCASPGGDGEAGATRLARALK